MAYTRKNWYTFWNADASHPTNRNKQVFDICPLVQFTYKQLKTDMQKCISEVKSINRKEQCAARKRTGAMDYNELKIAMRKFIQDVEQDKDLR